MEIIYKICLFFTVLGALNWGLIGLFDFNLVTTLFEEGSIIVKIIYILIGLCGLIDIGMNKKTLSLFFLVF